MQKYERRVTAEKMKNYLLCFGIAIVYLAVYYVWGSFFLSLTGFVFTFPPFLSILISIAILLLASFCLLIDYDDIVKAANHIDKKYEWSLTCSLLITLIWLYIRMLDLLVQIRE